RGPLEWRAFLEDQYRQCGLRERLVRDMLGDIDVEARALGVGIVKLKGAALLDLGVYDVGERPMADIDLLVRRHDVPVVREGVAVWSARGGAARAGRWREAASGAVVLVWCGGGGGGWGCVGGVGAGGAPRRGGAGGGGGDPPPHPPPGGVGRIGRPAPTTRQF